MSNEWRFVSGDWNVVCDVCGFKTKASRIKKRWDNLMVCPDDFEERHIQDFLRVKPDKITVPFIRKPEDVFLPEVCSIVTRHSYAGLGTADCMAAGYTMYTYEELLAALT